MNHPKNEKTFVLLKPDAVQRSLAGEIIGRIERTGLKLVGMKIVLATREQAVAHYNKDDAWCEKTGARMIKNLEAVGKTAENTAIEYGRDIMNGLLKYATCGPMVALVWQGTSAVGIVKKLVGGTEPLTSDVGTIRGDFTVDSYDVANIDNRAVRNLAHCSESPEEALREIALWFKEDEILNYRLINEEILYDVNIDGILE